MKKLLTVNDIANCLISRCGSKDNEKTDNANVQEEDETVTLKVASLIPPMTEILELVKPTLAEARNRTWKWLY